MKTNKDGTETFCIDSPEDAEEIMEWLGRRRRVTFIKAKHPKTKN